VGHCSIINRSKQQNLIEHTERTNIEEKKKKKEKRKQRQTLLTSPSAKIVTCGCFPIGWKQGNSEQKANGVTGEAKQW
jgi:hypothetical protein